MKSKFGLLWVMAALMTSCFSALSQVNFSPAVTYGTGPNSYSFSVADVNGDGKMDLIIGNEGNLPGPAFTNGTLSVFTNAGNGTFALFETVTLNHGPAALAAADVNGDGSVDLVTANWENGYGNTISIWTNNGAGIFGSNATLNVGNGARGITTGDINGDGKLDLICANLGLNSTGNTLTIFTNNGSGIFGLSQTPIVGSGAFSVTAADVNLDGHVDLISANVTDSSMTILTNNGFGWFGSNATYHVGASPATITAVDVNNDGKVDLIAPDWNSQNGNKLLVWTNNGAGIFSSNAAYVVGLRPYMVAPVDINGDGRIDLISANMFGDNNDVGNLSVLTNNGVGGFVLAATLVPGAFATDFPGSIFALDLSGDGKPDLVCVDIAANKVAVFKNNTIFPSPVSTPPLSINHQGNMAVVSWPSASAGWSLLQNPDLTTSHWAPSGYYGYGLTDDGTNKSLAIPSGPGNVYFRLIHP